jgi:two-component system NtrC family sensor kinase
MSDHSNPYYVAYLREKRARNEIEQLLEDSTRQLYEKNLLLQQQIEQIQQQQQSVIQQEKLATLGTLAAGVAHEVNNPLAFIVSNLETLNNYSHILLKALAQHENAHQQPQLQLIQDDLPDLFKETHQGLHRIKDIVHSLLFFARTDTDSVTAVDLQQAIEFSIKLLQPMLQQVSLTLDVHPVSHIQFVSNELNQLLLNILINAAQACETVTSRPSAITIRLYPTDNHIVLQISDNGCGMSEDTLSKMFDAFYTTKPVGTGTGVGMSIVLQILKKHHCIIEVTSELDVGTQISIHFPLPTF